MVVDYITCSGGDSFDAEEEKYTYNKFFLKSNKISSIELRKKMFSKGCSLHIHMDSGKNYGVFEELELFLNTLADEMKHKYSSVCEITLK